jgi:hypothetical protein
MSEKDAEVSSRDKAFAVSIKGGGGLNPAADGHGALTHQALNLGLGVQNKWIKSGSWDRPRNAVEVK